MSIHIVLDVRYWSGICQQSQSLEEAVCWELLIDCRRRGVDLLYSNMEKLLPLPLTQLTAPIRKPEKSVSESQDHPSVDPKKQPSSTCLPSDTLLSQARSLHVTESGDCSDDGSPIKVSNRMKKNKRRHCVPGQDGMNSDSDSEESFLSLSKPKGGPQAKEEVKERLVSEMVKRKQLTPEERMKSLPVSQCLESIADFLDNMSYLDSSLHVHREGGDNHRRMTPVGAVVKDGMTDESRVETDRGSWETGERVLEIQAAVEALSFHRWSVFSCRGLGQSPTAGRRAWTWGGRRTHPPCGPSSWRLQLLSGGSLPTTVSLTTISLMLSLI